MKQSFIITAFAGLVIFFFAQPVAGQEPSGAYALRLSPFFGMMYGQAEEIVYPSGTKAPLLSQLLWDMKPVFYYGLLLEFSQINPREKWGFFSNFSLKQGIPGNSGSMEDRDWQSVENTNLTDYSKHNNYTRELFFLDFSAGLSFPFNRVLLFKTFINISYMRFSFYGKDGYGTYAVKISDGHYYPIDENPILVDFSGKVISYTQEWLTVAPGVSLGCFFHPRFYTELSFMASPLVLCFDLDEHKELNDQYRDEMRGGVLFEPGLMLSYTINKWLAVSWEFSWRKISGTKGLTYKRNPIGTGTYEQKGEAGAGLSIINTNLSLKVRL